MKLEFIWSLFEGLIVQDLPTSNSTSSPGTAHFRTMGKQIFPVFGLIAIGYGVLIYFAGRQAVRNTFNGADPTGLMAMTGGLIQFVLLSLIFLVIISGSVSLAKTLKIHKM